MDWWPCFQRGILGNPDRGADPFDDRVDTLLLDMLSDDWLEARWFQVRRGANLQTSISVVERVQRPLVVQEERFCSFGAALLLGGGVASTGTHAAGRLDHLSAALLLRAGFHGAGLEAVEMHF